MSNSSESFKRDFQGVFSSSGPELVDGWPRFTEPESLTEPLEPRTDEEIAAMVALEVHRMTDGATDVAYLAVRRALWLRRVTDDSEKQGGIDE